MRQMEVEGDYVTRSNLIFEIEALFNGVKLSVQLLKNKLKVVL